MFSTHIESAISNSCPSTRMTRMQRNSAPGKTFLRSPSSPHSRLVSAPISLHWLWTPENQQFQTTTFSTQEREARTEFIKKKATEVPSPLSSKEEIRCVTIGTTRTALSSTSSATPRRTTLVLVLRLKPDSTWDVSCRILVARRFVSLLEEESLAVVP